MKEQAEDKIVVCNKCGDEDVLSDMNKILAGDESAYLCLSCYDELILNK